MGGAIAFGVQCKRSVEAVGLIGVYPRFTHSRIGA